MGVTPTPSPEPSNNFCAQATPIQADTSQPIEAEESFGETRGKLRITSSYVHFTLARAAWTWGKRPPPSINSMQLGQHSVIGEAELWNDSVCQN
jgi:hypothetical protein